MEIIGGGKMEGTYFYFCVWMGWIITTFFFKKDGFRLGMSFFLLLMIIGSQMAVSVFSFSISGSALLLASISFVGISVYSRWMQLYTLICALIIAMIYTIFHVIELYDPVWIVIDRTWMLSGILVYASVLLHRNRTLRVWGLYVGMLQGELFLTFIFKAMHVTYDIGGFSFLNSAAASTVLFSLLHSIGKVVSYTGQFKRKQVKEG